MRVFTHRSFAARPTHVFEDSPEDPSPDNEQFSPVSLSLSPPVDDLLLPQRLEHVGDQVLGLIVTDLLQSEYPYLRVGPSTVRIVCSCLIFRPTGDSNGIPPPFYHFLFF